MEEKERYICKKIDGYYWIKDTETNENYCVNNSIVKLLNQQDKRIKELECKLRVSNSLNSCLSLEHSELKKQYGSQEKLLSQKLAENSILKQSQKELVIGELEWILELLKYPIFYEHRMHGETLSMFLKRKINSRIKELKENK